MRGLTYAIASMDVISTGELAVNVDKIIKRMYFIHIKSVTTFGILQLEEFYITQFAFRVR